MWIETSTSGKLGDMAKRPSDESAALRAVAQARDALEKAEAAVIKRREDLLARMVEAARSGESTADIARSAKYEQPHARRVLRKAGVEAKQPNRIPPPGFRRAKVDAD
jgi:sRNA-binding protein